MGCAPPQDFTPLEAEAELSGAEGTNLRVEYLTPGTGFTGPTALPPPTGQPSQPGYSHPAIARWNVVPHQDFTGTLHVGVLAFHSEDIERVSFSVEGGAWKSISQVSVNPQSRTEEYWVALKAADFPDRRIEVRAIAHPRVGIPRLLPSLYLNANARGGLPRAIKYVSPQGNDTTGNGTSSNPFRSISRAAKAIEAEHRSLHPDFDAGGGTIYLLPGSHTLGMGSWNDEVRTQNRWLTIARLPSSLISRVKLVDNPNSMPLGIPKVRFLTLTTELIRPTTIFRTKNPGVEQIWLDGMRFIGRGPFTDLTWVDPAYQAQYVTETSVESAMDGFKHAALQRNVTAKDIGGHPFTGTDLLVNCTIDTLNGPSDPDHHPDVYQFYGPESSHENTIIYGLKTRGIIHAQGIFAGNGIAITNVAIVKSQVNNQVTNEAGRAFLFMGPTKNLVVKDSEFTGPAAWEASFTASHVVLQNTRFYSYPQAQYCRLPPDLSGVISGVTYRCP